jgi:hypothetical protein
MDMPRSLLPLAAVSLARPLRLPDDPAAASPVALR